MAGIKDGDPMSRAVVTEADLVPLPLHAADHIAHAAPAVEPAVEELQLGFVGRHEGEAHGRAKKEGAVVVGHRLGMLPTGAIVALSDASLQGCGP